MNAEPKKLDMIREIYKNNHNIAGEGVIGYKMSML